eukprot:3098501-Rhodomonas_salina.2
MVIGVEGFCDAQSRFVTDKGVKAIARVTTAQRMTRSTKVKCLSPLLIGWLPPHKIQYDAKLFEPLAEMVAVRIGVEHWLMTEEHRFNLRDAEAMPCRDLNR